MEQGTGVHELATFVLLILLTEFEFLPIFAP